MPRKFDRAAQDYGGPQGESDPTAFLRALQESQRALQRRIEHLEAELTAQRAQTPNETQRGGVRFHEAPMLVAGDNMRLDKTDRVVKFNAILPDPGDELEAVGVNAPLYPMVQGDLDVIFREMVYEAFNQSQAWERFTVGGGSATTLTASTTNYCWLEITHTRYNADDLYQWGVDSLAVVVNTNATYQPASEPDDISGNSANARAIKFAEITTDSDKITGFTYFPFCLSPNSDKALSITPLTSGGMTSVTVVTDFQVDTINKKLEIKTRTIGVYNPGSESAWTTKHTGGSC